MRTKTLLLTAALCAAGVATSMAQVFSVNAVGYVNLVIPAGFSIIANPLNGATNTVSQLFAGAPDGTILYPFINASGKYSPNNLIFGSWDRPNDLLTPGLGAFIKAPSTFTNTFVGEVMQGSLTNPIPAGFSIISSQVPQAGKLSTDLGYSATEGDKSFQFVNASGKYTVRNFTFGAWDTEPTLAVGEGIFLQAAVKTSWNRTFTTQQ